MHLAQAVVMEHQEYLEAVRELTDWLMTAGEELQHWSDTSGDSTAIRKKLSVVKVKLSVMLVSDFFKVCWRRGTKYHRICTNASTEESILLL